MKERWVNSTRVAAWDDLQGKRILCRDMHRNPIRLADRLVFLLGFPKREGLADL